jgi:hypothetical protein
MKSTMHVNEIVHGKILEVNLHGKLGRRDFDRLVPDTERLIRQYGKIRILVTLREFHGWNLGALWDEIKWEAKHFNDVERIAIVGDESWHRFMAGLCKPFTTASVRFFKLDQLDNAHRWLNEGEWDATD